jgi:hypothetical protein
MSDAIAKEVDVEIGCPPSSSKLAFSRLMLRLPRLSKFPNPGISFPNVSTSASPNFAALMAVAAPSKFAPIAFPPFRLFSMLLNELAPAVASAKPIFRLNTPSCCPIY